MRFGNLNSLMRRKFNSDYTTALVDSYYLFNATIVIHHNHYPPYKNSFGLLSSHKRKCKFREN